MNKSTARHAADVGFRVAVVRDACSAATAKAHAASLSAVSLLTGIVTADEAVCEFAPIAA